VPVLSPDEEKQLLGFLELTRSPWGKDRKPPNLEEVKKAFAALPARLRTIPAVAGGAGLPQPPNELVKAKEGDNSNAQFAMLALWPAYRRGMPVGRCLALAARGFRHAQGTDGTWRYRLGGNNNRPAPTMTGAGLFALAVQHRLAVDAGGKREVVDEQVNRGLKALGGLVKVPAGRAKEPIDFYRLWTVGRVGVLYNVRTMGGKDWYRWGADPLLSAQRPNGSWQQSNYGSASPFIDTSFALLFLRRSNPANGLTRQVWFADLPGK
jgi:hypothetical protein